MRKEPLVMCVTNVVAAVEGGVTCVQYRNTESAAGKRFARVRRLHDALRKSETQVIVNNDADLAASVKAAGVGGLAVVSAFSKSSDPFATAQEFRRMFQ